MNRTAVVTATALVTAMGMSGPVLSEDMHTELLARFVGTWDMSLHADEATFGEQGGPGHGTMVCEWGVLNTWMDCEMEAVYENLGPYALKIVLYRLHGDNELGAFVTNNFGGGRLYVGGPGEDGNLRFRDAWVDATSGWLYQDVIYTFDENGEISFTIEVSADNRDYKPHSSGRYVRKGDTSR